MGSFVIVLGQNMTIDHLAPQPTLSGSKKTTVEQFQRAARGAEASTAGNLGVAGAEALPNLRAAQHLNQIGRNANPKVVAPAGQSGEEKRDNTPNR